MQQPTEKPLKIHTLGNTPPGSMHIPDQCYTTWPLVSCPVYFSHTERKNSLVNGLFCFCSKRHAGGAPIRLLHENDVTYCKNSEATWLKRYTSIIQETKPDRTRERTSEGMPELPWMHGMCFWACQLAGWSSWDSDVNKIVLALSEVDRGFKFCESSFLGVLKLREEWSLLRAVSLALFHSVTTCLTSHNTFLKTWRHQFLNRTVEYLSKAIWCRREFPPFQVTFTLS